MSERETLLTDRLNQEINLWKGCTANELGIMLLISFVLNSSLFIVLGGLIWGQFLYGFIVGLMLTIPFALPFILWLGRIKYGKPPGYVSQYIWKTATRWGVKSPFLDRSGRWSVSRREDY